jgi:hypothetical protein
MLTPSLKFKIEIELKLKDSQTEDGMLLCLRITNSLPKARLKNYKILI